MPTDIYQSPNKISATTTAQRELLFLISQICLETHNNPSGNSGSKSLSETQVSTFFKNTTSELDV